jgi:hypothetical protein
MTVIALGFVLIATLILWFIIGSKGHWGSKAAMILLSLYFCLSVGFSVSDFMGWPTEEKLPEKFRVYWLVIDEPDPKVGDGGSIYVWLQPNSTTEITRDSWDDYLISFYDGDSEPRAYRLPYTRELHKKTQQALDTLMGGGSVGGTSEGEGNGEGNGDEGEGEGKKDQGGHGEGSLSRDGGLMFHDLPPTKLPDKD